MSAQRTEIVTIADRPDLAPLVAAWLWHEFWQQEDYTLVQTEAAVAQATAVFGPPQVFVLLADGLPIGTASLDAGDLDTRPDLTPWLANVFVTPAARGHGHAATLIAAVEAACRAATLIAAVEAACRAAAIRTLWLYTNTAQQIYTKAGWQTAAYFDLRGRETALMRRDLQA